MLNKRYTTKNYHQGVVGCCKALMAGLLISLSAGSLADTSADASEVSPDENLLAAQIRVASMFADEASEDGIVGERCLPARRIRGVDVLDNRTLLFDMGREKHYLVRLERQCYGLRRNTPISYEINGGRLCRTDGIRALETWGHNRFVPGPRCLIPSFINVNETELSLVKERLAAEKGARLAQSKAKKEARKAAKRAEKEAKKAAKAAAREQNA